MKELRFDLSEAKSIRRIRQRTESWSPLADGQIIAQGTLRPIVCHGGYDVEGIKRAVIWANRGRLTGGFELIFLRVQDREVVVLGFSEEGGKMVLLRGSKGDLGDRHPGGEEGVQNGGHGGSRRKAEALGGLLQDRELEMVGTLMYMRDDFLTAVELMDLGKVTPTEMITARFKFRNLPEAYREADENRGRNLKVMVEF